MSYPVLQANMLKHGTAQQLVLVLSVEEKCAKK